MVSESSLVALQNYQESYCVGVLLLHFLLAVIIKCHRLGGVSNRNLFIYFFFRNLFFHSSEAWGSTGVDRVCPF